MSEGVEILRFAIVGIIGDGIFGSGGGNHADALDTLGAFRVAVDGDQDAVDAYVRGSDLERDRHLSREGLDYAFLTAAKNGVVRAAHTDVGDICGTAGEDAFIGGDDVGVGAEDAGDAAVEIVAHGDLLGRGLGVDIKKDDVGLVFEFTDDGIGCPIGAIRRFHKDAAEKGEGADSRALGSCINGEILPRRRGAPVGGSDDVCGVLERRDYISLAIGVVAEGDEIRTVSDHLVVYLRSTAGAAGCILGVDNDAVDLVIANKRAKLPGYHVPAGSADHIANTEYVYLHRPLIPKKDRNGLCGARCILHYLAYSTQRTSRSRVTLISPGYVISSSIFLAISRAIFVAESSSILLASTMTRISRPACIA